MTYGIEWWEGRELTSVNIQHIRYPGIEIFSYFYSVNDPFPTYRYKSKSKLTYSFSKFTANNPKKILQAFTLKKKYWPKLLFCNTSGNSRKKSQRGSNFTKFCLEIDMGVHSLYLDCQPPIDSN